MVEYCLFTHHCIRAAKVPVKFRTEPGKISAETIHGIPLRPNDQLPPKLAQPFEVSLKKDEECLQYGINHNHGSSRLTTSRSRRGQLLPSGNHARGMSNLDIAAHDPEAYRAHEGRNDRGVASTPEIDKETVENDRRHS